MVDAYEKFELLFDQLEKRAKDKDIIIWGYGAQGRLIEEIFTLRGMPIEAIIDDGIESPNVYDHSILTQYDFTTIFLIIAVGGDAAIDIKSILYRMGFHNNYIIIREWFYNENNSTVDYYRWVETQLDVNMTAVEENKVKNGNPYGIIYGIDLKKILSNFEFHENDAVFDFGCGRGAALSMFAHCGIDILGGVELNTELFNSAKKNMKELGIRAELLCGDARECLALEKYNYFFMYNPFGGDLFQQVITNIENSYTKRKRKIVLIYAVPLEHEKVINHGMFQLVDEIKIASGRTKTANIYVIDE